MKKIVDQLSQLMVEVAHAKVNDDHRYTVFTLAYWADREDYHYAPIIEPYKTIVEAQAQIVLSLFKAIQMFFDGFPRKRPMIVVNFLMKAGNKNMFGTFAHVLNDIKKYCVYGKEPKGLYRFGSHGSSSPFDLVIRDETQTFCGIVHNPPFPSKNVMSRYLDELPHYFICDSDFSESELEIIKHYFAETIHIEERK